MYILFRHGLKKEGGKPPAFSTLMSRCRLRYDVAPQHCVDILIGVAKIGNFDIHSKFFGKKKAVECIFSGFLHILCADFSSFVMKKNKFACYLA